MPKEMYPLLLLMAIYSAYAFILRLVYKRSIRLKPINQWSKYGSLKYFQEIESGRKDFELRKNDRDYRVGDLVFLEESVNGIKTGRMIGGLRIKYVLRDCKEWGLLGGYCIFTWHK